MANFVLFPLRFMGSVIGLLGRFGIGGTVERIRNGSVKFNPQGMAFYRPNVDTNRVG